MPVLAKLRRETLAEIAEREYDERWTIPTTFDA
jgi:hypothetical protein